MESIAMADAGQQVGDPVATSHRLRGAIFSLLAVVLFWQVLSRSFVAYLSETAPETALLLRSDDPVALVNLGDRKLNLDQPLKDLPDGAKIASEEPRNRISSFARHGGAMVGGSDPSQGRGGAPAEATERLASNAADPALRQEVSSLTRLALMHDPLNARALRILGQLAEAENDETKASAFMRAAARRSLRESVAVFWLMREGFDHKDYQAAVRYADILLRTRPQILPQVMPTLTRIAENKEAAGELKQLLIANPPWRGMFFDDLTRSMTDARTPLDLLLSIKNTPTPPTATDLNNYLTALIGHKFQELAYYVWLQFLPPEQLASVGLLFNGSFERLPSGMPFDWVVTPGTGVTVDFVPRPDLAGQRALLVEFGLGRVDFRGIAQITMMAPGTYKLTGQLKGQLTGRRGLEWRITCADASDPLAKSAMALGTIPVWIDFAVPFTVPEANCRSQKIALVLDARSASEQLVSGSMWYDDLQVVRMP